MIDIAKIQEQRKISKLLRDSIAKDGFLTGYTVANIMGVDHAVFHDTLYNYFRNQANVPQIYEYDSQIGKYVPAVDPFLDPLRGLQLYGTATYEIRKCDIAVLTRLFPREEKMIEIIDAVLD